VSLITPPFPFRLSLWPLRHVIAQCEAFFSAQLPSFPFLHQRSFEPDNIELDTKLKPFIPDYIPAVGDIDPFIKVPRPDGKPTGLGLEVLDEPAADQSGVCVGVCFTFIGFFRKSVALSL
jgi:hypothetical protein